MQNQKNPMAFALMTWQVAALPWKSVCHHYGYDVKSKLSSGCPQANLRGFHPWECSPESSCLEPRDVKAINSLLTGDGIGKTKDAKTKAEFRAKSKEDPIAYLLSDNPADFEMGMVVVQGDYAFLMVPDGHGDLYEECLTGCNTTYVSGPIAGPDR